MDETTGGEQKVYYGNSTLAILLGRNEELRVLDIPRGTTGDALLMKKTH